MTLLGLDLNASRARAVCGAAGVPRPIALDGAERELPLAISLERRRPEVGRAGAALCRRLPHFACLNFLPHLGTPREWCSRRHRLDAAAAMSLVLARLQPACAGVRGLALALPSYLERPQAGELASLAKKARLPLLGSVTTPLAAAWMAHAHRPWRGLAVVIDTDEHALSFTALAADEPEAARHIRTLLAHEAPKLSLRAWKERLLDCIADRCIRQSRRDLRDSAPAEQTLYDQLDEACDVALQNQTMELAIQAAHWYQTLILTPAELNAFCKPLVRRTLEEMNALLLAAQAEGPPAAVLLSEAAARLPGLALALGAHSGAATAVSVMPADTPARAAHELAERWRSGTMPSGHLDVSLPLLRSSPAGPRPAAKVAPRPGNTQLPRGSVGKLSLPDDDFSVTIED